MPFKGDFITKNIDDTWAMVKEDFDFYSDWMDQTFKIKAGFITDYASVPRIPILFELLGGRGKRPATLHDKGYSEQELAKRCYDLLFFEGMIDTWVHDAILMYAHSSGWRAFPAFWRIIWRFFLASLMWIGVVLGGWPTWLKYKKRKAAGLPIRPEAPECYDDRWEDRIF